MGNMGNVQGIDCEVTFFRADYDAFSQGYPLRSEKYPEHPIQRCTLSVHSPMSKVIQDPRPRIGRSSPEARVLRLMQEFRGTSFSAGTEIIKCDRLYLTHQGCMAQTRCFRMCYGTCGNGSFLFLSSLQTLTDHKTLLNCK